MHAIRDARPDLEAATGTELWVTGAAAANIDITEKLADAFPLFLLIVVGLAIVLLLVAFRSILVPVTAVLGFLLTIAAAFGATTAVFQWGWLSGVFNVDSDRPAAQLPADPAGRRPVRAGHGLPGVPGLPDARGARARRRPGRRRSASGSRTAPAWSLAAALIMISVFSSFVFSGPRRSARSRSRWPSASCSTRSWSA